MSPATCDTSVLVPALLSWHQHHAAARAALAGGLTVLPGHVLLETYSVLTRLPAPHRISPSDARTALASLEARPLLLPPERHVHLIGQLARVGLGGGAVYDALVAATALEHEVELLTLDRRAVRAYEVVGAAFRVVQA
ncbi:PIN domain-containing protein [Ornithinimicrobium tianjinense]|uniref:Ribonuclease VapC n=1 Tax=Ornithinimicrobium tianjinense TaxID=1195761 RepID=A0A917BWJ3_9MICO|nr:PIN domain-containing protein [Ornithinimicrobium tianjinense]GGF60162.1 ribonuclease VapC [Ornithinimicrobium tianjinense]